MSRSTGMCESDLLENGLSLRHIQGLLGHASPTTTALYAQLTPTVESTSLSVINRLVNTLRGGRCLVQ